MSGRRVLVCGPRDFSDYQLMDWALTTLQRKHGIACIIEGECPTPVNADKLAARWGEEHGVPVERYAVDHKVDGPWPGAGPRRNRRMRDQGLPTAAIAFADERFGKKGSGTTDMVNALREIGMHDIWIIPINMPTMTLASS